MDEVSTKDCWVVNYLLGQWFPNFFICLGIFYDVLAHLKKSIFNSQLNTSGCEPRTCDTPVSHSIDIPTEELKKYCDHWNT